MLTIDEARARLAERAAPLPSAEFSLAAALGLRLAADAHADVEMPPADVSAMDGYTARASDLAAGAPLPVAFAVSAGEAAPPLPAGRVARIFTGAMVPEGADTVVQQEVAELRPDGLVVLPALPVGTNVRPRGEVFVVGARVAAVGELVTPGRVGLLAAAGAARLTVIPRPRVAVVLTGNELVGVGSRPNPGQIRDSNGAMLAALAAEAGLAVTALDTVGDELEATSAALARAAAGADLVVTTGGVSVGDRDLVPAAIGRLGGETVLHKVAMQPGKPILVARLGGAWLVGLPGNPVSALVGWRMFVRPLAEALAGDGAAFAEVGVTAELEAAVRNGGDRTQLRPAVFHRGGTGLAVSVRRWHGSHDVMAAAPANALARLEVGADLAAGAPVVCYPLPWRWTA
jgi:molybdopterin molybdotransferase